MVGHEAPPSEAGETRPLPEAKTPALIRTMMMMMMVLRRRRRGGVGTLFVPLKVRDALKNKSTSSSEAHQTEDRAARLRRHEAAAEALVDAHFSKIET